MSSKIIKYENIKDKMLQNAEKALVKYHEDYIDKNYLSMAITDILSYAKQGFFCKEDDTELLYDEDKDAYEILRLAKEGKLKVYKQNG